MRDVLSDRRVRSGGFGAAGRWGGVLGVGLVGVGLVLGGCSNAGQGVASGAALGALVGMGLGSLSGDMGKGAAAGALIGGAGGAVLGDQNARRDEWHSSSRGGSGSSNGW